MGYMLKKCTTKTKTDEAFRYVLYSTALSLVALSVPARKPIPRGVRGCVSQSHGSGPSLEERGGMGVQVCDVFSGGPHTALTMRCLLLLLSDGG